ncbi:hypothetical protein CBL_05059 [Carabus blaptoides fortunei]
MDFTVQEKISLIKFFFGGNSYRKTCDLFAGMYPERPIPSKTENHKDPEKVKIPTAVEENILAKIELEPKTSLRNMEQETGMSKTNIHRILKRHNYKSYKAANHQKLLEGDKERRSDFCLKGLTRLTTEAVPGSLNQDNMTTAQQGLRSPFPRITYQSTQQPPQTGAILKLPANHKKTPLSPKMNQLCVQHNRTGQQHHMATKLSKASSVTETMSIILATVNTLGYTMARQRIKPTSLKIATGNTDHNPDLLATIHQHNRQYLLAETASQLRSATSSGERTRLEEPGKNTKTSTKEQL